MNGEQIGVFIKQKVKPLYVIDFQLTYKVKAK